MIGLVTYLIVVVNLMMVFGWVRHLIVDGHRLPLDEVAEGLEECVGGHVGTGVPCAMVVWVANFALASSSSISSFSNYWREP